MRSADGRRALVAVVIASLAACAPPRPNVAPLPTSPTPPGFPEAAYRREAAAGAVYRVDPAASRIVVDVRRGGSLARLGHDHVVASRDVHGYVAADAGRADLYVPLDRLTVDEPSLRAQAGLDGTLSPADIEGTRDNMRHRVLHTERNAFATIAVRREPGGRFVVAITLNGVTRTQDVPVAVTSDAATLEARGRLALAQTDFGLVPFSILDGAIAVADRVDLAFDIHARRIAQ
jgi:hypothetical protein